MAHNWQTYYIKDGIDDIAGMQRERLINTEGERERDEISLPANKGVAGFLDIYVILDTRYRKARFAERMRNNNITFDLINGRIDKDQGQIKVPVSAAQIIEMELMKPFLFPKENLPDDADYLDPYFQSEITMEITNINMNAYDEGNGTKHHFSLLTASADRKRLLLTPHNPKMLFSYPINLSQISLRFRTPVELANFDDDYYMVSITYTNPATLVVVGDFPHNFTSNVDCIAFQEFKSGEYDSENENSLVYREKFYPVTVVNNITFTVPVDFSGISNGPAATRIYVGNRRMRIPLRLRLVRNFNTNFTVATS